MSEDILSYEDHFAFTEGTIENLLKGGATLDHALKVLYYLYKANNIKPTDEELKNRINLIQLDMLQEGSFKPRGRNIQQELEDLMDFKGRGEISLADVYSDLNLKTKEERNACRVGFQRLIIKGRVEKPTTGKTGKYRIVDKDIELIDIFSASTNEFDLKIPLGVNDFVKIHPGCVLMVAGESNSGKTAMCLNIARMNKGYHPINYLSSEMQSGSELKIRLQEFKIPLEYWKDVRFIFRTDSFPDVIQPNAINIIDYLDEGGDGEAYKMVGRIRDIGNKIKDGIAVIAIQKHSSKSFGFGGEGTLNRARLYLSITRQGILKIEKGKIWKQGNINPNGLQIKFKLVAGCQFIKDGEWSK